MPTRRSQNVTDARTSLHAYVERFPEIREGSLKGVIKDAVSIEKPALSRGDLQVMAATAVEGRARVAPGRAHRAARGHAIPRQVRDAPQGRHQDLDEIDGNSVLMKLTGNIDLLVFSVPVTM